MELRPTSSAYVWLDLEFTSLEFERASLLQIAVVLTDTSLKRLADPSLDLNLFIRLEPGTEVSPWVRENLPDLIQKCRGDDAVPMTGLDDRLCAYLDDHVGPASSDVSRRPIVAGSSVHADYYLLRRLLPGFIGRCHYRLLDVTAIKLQWIDFGDGKEIDKENPEVLRAYFPEAVVSGGPAVHDAYYDVQASIAELAYYRTSFFRSSSSAVGADAPDV
jgi:oligoribonuclease